MWSKIGNQTLSLSITISFLHAHVAYESVYIAELLPHVIIFLEKCIVLHSSLLQLHIYAAAIYGHHFLYSTGGGKERKKKDLEITIIKQTKYHTNQSRLKFRLLHTTETSGQLHDGSQRVTSGHRGGQVGDEKTFQNIQDLIFCNL